MVELDIDNYNGAMCWVVQYGYIEITKMMSALGIEETWNVMMIIVGLCLRQNMDILK